MTDVGVRADPPLSFWQAWSPIYVNWILSIVLSVPRIAVKWTCDQLDWFSLIIITFINTISLWTRPLSKQRISRLFCSGCRLPIRFLSCLELFHNSQRMWPLSWPPILLTSLLPVYHENHLIWVDSNPIVFLKLVWDYWPQITRTSLTSLIHLKNHLIGVNSIKVIPLWFAQYVPGVYSRILT